MNNSPGELCQLLYRPDPPAPCAPGTLYTLPKEMHPWFSSSHLSSSPPPPPIKYLVSVVGKAHIPGSPVAFTHCLTSSLSLIRYMSCCSSQLSLYAKRQQGDGTRRWAPETFRFLPPRVALSNMLKSQLCAGKRAAMMACHCLVQNLSQIDALWIRMLRCQTHLFPLLFVIVTILLSGL